jgi:UDP-N-acetylglucosamine--N-acetylmuramyl-(pentapeptide) pyrophosphoryl-undecaprenol N-acetylglucosamine transferase
MKYAVLVAGGTGGHINAALAIGEALMDKSYEIAYLTGKRHLDYKLFASHKVKHLNSRPLRTKNPFTLIQNIFLNLASFLNILGYYLKIGAGGYVCGPTLLAAYLLGIPVFIIEQNAVMGLTNRILGWLAKKIFVHFSETKGLSPNLSARVRVVGNPTRKSIQPPGPKKESDSIRVLVFGGSLGASQINDVIYEIVKNPPFENLEIHHQTGSQKIPEFTSSIIYRAQAYIDNIQEEYEWCDVIISRSGASTVSELRIIKKPTLIFPFPQATDNHQVFNAEILRKESDFDVIILPPRISKDEAVASTVDFLRRAREKELLESTSPSLQNRTCEEILKEIGIDG